MRRLSLSRSSFALVVTTLFVMGGCTMEQDLGRDEFGNAGDPNLALSSDPHAGFGAGWACPASGATSVPLARDLACPMSKPIVGDGCPFASSAPCMFDEAHTACICTSDRRWSCIESVWFRTLKHLPASGEACAGAIEIARPCTAHEGAGAASCEVTCRCVDGAYRCER
ncbi:MAG: hypothetical protein ACXVEF_31210 [Polyangiales bacterium]